MKKKIIAIIIVTMMSFVGCGNTEKDIITSNEKMTESVSEMTEITETIGEQQDRTETTEIVEGIVIENDTTIDTNEEKSNNPSITNAKNPSNDKKDNNTNKQEQTTQNPATNNNTQTDDSKDETQISENIPAKPVHTHSYTSKVTKQPTCMESGEKIYTCSCGKTKTETIAKTAHNYDNGMVTKQPTCNSKGQKTFKCTTCTATYTEDIAAVAHEWKHHDAEYKTVTVTVKEAWDEDVYEDHVICGGCGKDFGMGPAADDAAGEHLIEADFFGPCQNYSVKSVKVNTIHHPAITETRQELVKDAYDECTKCGTRK